MFRKLLATTALATLLATGAYAQDAAAPAPAPAAPSTETPAAPVVRAEGSLVTNIVGESVYNGTGDDAESIGKVTDVVFDKDGQAKSIVIGVGGFLGVGTKEVAFDYDKLQWAEKNGDRWLVAKTSKDELTAEAAFDRTPYQPTPPPAAAPSSDNGTATAPAGGGTTASGGDTAMAPTPPAEIVEPDGTLATLVVGESVYNGTADDAEKIGDVKDMVLDKEGKAQSLVIGVGGFLGLGQKAVAFDYSKAKWAEKNGDRWFVVEGASKDELKALPDFDRKAYDPAPASTAAASDAPPAVVPTTTADKGDAVTDTDKTATAPAESDTSATDGTSTAAIDKSTLTEMPADKISADNLIGTTVYGADDAKIGKIGDIVLTPDNKVDAVVVDVGGFLGIGSKPVAVGMDKLKFMTDKDNSNTYLYTNFTKDELQAQAAYDKGSYAEKRDEQRMILR